VRDPILCELGVLVEGGSSFRRVFSKWLSGSLKGHMSDLLEIFWRWNLIGMRPASASMPSRGDVLKAPRIQVAALLCILLRTFM